MSDHLRPFDPDNDPVRDDERDNRGSNDPTGYEGGEARLQSRRCPHCRGNGLAFVFHFDYQGGPVLIGIDDRGNRSKQIARTVAYCTCLYGRWLLENHQKTAKDVYRRLPDLADITGQASFWLDRDPTYRELDADEITALPANYREMMIRRINARAEANR